MAITPGRSNLKTLYLIKILSELTDEEHALNASQLGAILRRDYDIEINRQTIYSEIGKLMDFGMDIVQKKDEKLGGYYLASRQFELAELKLLVDAVQSSRFITEKKSRDLIRKLEELCSREEARQISSQVIVCNRAKTTNETIYYNVDMLHSAIFHNRQITYQYVEWTVRKKLEPRHEGAFYVVSPLHLVWDDENYYLIAYDEKDGKVKHFRVDKMRSMSILGAQRSREASVCQVDMASFGKKTFGMFGGEDVQVRLLCKEHLAGVILDRFGTGTFITPGGEGRFAASVTVTVSPQFFGWVTAIGSDMQIDGPKEVKEAYRAYLRQILEEYDPSGEVSH